MLLPKLERMRCSRCNSEYIERRENYDDVTHFLCAMCEKKYVDIRDFYEKQRYNLARQESDAIWDFLMADRECMK